MGSIQSHDLYGLIKEIILTETIFLRHYLGTVYSNTDKLQAGRVQVLLKDFGWDSPDMGLWCWPRQGNGQSVPAVGSWVEVYFINGDSGHPVYLFPASEVSENTPSKFDGMPSTHLLFQDPNDQNGYIKYDANQGLYDAFGKFKIDKSQGKINMLDATKKFVLGDDLDTWLKGALKTFCTTHTHPYLNVTVPSDTSASGMAFTDPSNYLSDDIKGS